MAKKTKNPDFRVTGGGSVFLLHPVSKAAKAWASEHLPEDAQRFGNAVVVEHRYISDVVHGAMADGLTVLV
jgi:hypothetical protein